MKKPEFPPNALVVLKSCCSEMGHGLVCWLLFRFGIWAFVRVRLVGLIKTKMLGGNGDDTNDSHLFLP